MRLSAPLQAILLFPTILFAVAPAASLQIDSHSLFRLDVLSSAKIESIDDATAFVRSAVDICGSAVSAVVGGDFESRLAAAELNAARDPRKLISDDQVAKAFNFSSREFGVANPTVLTAGDILHYRGVMSAIFPHVFSPKTLSGGRPVGVAVMLYMLVSYGGMTEGWKRVGGPNSFGISEAEPLDRPGVDRRAVATEYEIASVKYFQKAKPEEVRRFLDRLAKIIDLPEGIRP